MLKIERKKHMGKLEDKLKQHNENNIYPFHMPGHKRTQLTFAKNFANPYDIDITEIAGFDNLHHADGILKEAQENAASLYGAMKSFFLVNGSTCGLLAAISAATKRGDEVLVARNCHKAVYHVLYLRQLKPVYLYPSITKSGIQGQICAEDVKNAIKENPNITAVIITSPTYDGVVSDIEQIAKMAHEKGIPLIADEAHGAHFGFGGDFPQNAGALGADAVIVSLHKTLPAFTQTALLNIYSDLIDKRKLEQFLDIYETSSPSYVLMAGIDNCIEYMSAKGSKPFESLRGKLDDFYDKTKLSKLRLVRKKDFSKEEAFDFDESKILIFTDKTDITGAQLTKRLREKFDIELEMAAGDYALVLCSIMDTDEGFDRLSKALMQIDGEISFCSKSDTSRKSDSSSNGNSSEKSSSSSKSNPSRRSSLGSKSNPGNMYRKLVKKGEIYEAFETLHDEVQLENAVGLTSAGFINIYPPGIPLVVPGEVIDEQLANDVRFAIECGLEVNGVTEGSVPVVSRSD